MQERRAGILLHPTSLPGPEGIGTLGEAARQFIDRIRESGFTLWQLLPLGPTGYGNSPYSSYSAFAGNPLLIDLESLIDEGDLGRDELPETCHADRVDFGRLIPVKTTLLRKAASRFLGREVDERKREFWHFCDTTFWLHDYALFTALRRHFAGKGWTHWPQDVRSRNKESLNRWSEILGEEIGVEKYLQWQIRRQWNVVRSHAANRGVLIVGDMPIYVAHDSCDVWCNQHLFMLDPTGRPTHRAGVPPDYFSRNGQLWGNPLYRWERHHEDRFAWWTARIRSDLQLFDIIRLDHFRGFSACWGVPASHRTARGGSWFKTPGHALFDRILEELGSLPFIAEDLGVITPEVEQLRDQYRLPGMKILQFAFEGGASNPYLPHNHTPDSVVYTGTHDNDTLIGWASSLPSEQCRRVASYFGHSSGDLSSLLVRAALSSVSRLAIMPLQDLLRLGREARMNVPGTAQGNWEWRCTGELFEHPAWGEIKPLLEMYDRVR